MSIFPVYLFLLMTSQIVYQPNVFSNISVKQDNSIRFIMTGIAILLK